jgi:hypothetical protein
MLQISHDALRIGCERAQDLFTLNRLRGAEGAASGLDATYGALGIDAAMRERLQRELTDLVPVKGVPMIEMTAAASMLAGVLVGLLIADSTLPGDELDIPVVR